MDKNNNDSDLQSEEICYESVDSYIVNGLLKDSQNGQDEQKVIIYATYV